MKSQTPKSFFFYFSFTAVYLKTSDASADKVRLFVFNEFSEDAELPRR